MESLRRVFGRLDAAVFQVERALLVLSLAMMTVLVTLDVLQRTFSRQQGKTASILLALLSEPTPATRALVVDWIAPGVFGALSLAFVVLAVQARRSMAAKGAKVGLGPSVAWGAGVWVAGALFLQALLWLFPSSVPGAQKFALGFMLWAGMLGASLATRSRRHIVLDTVVKKLEGKTQRWFFLFSGVVAGAFCGFLGFLGSLQFLDQLRDWASGEGVGVYESLPIPTWIATLSVPAAFLVMAARFVGLGVHDFHFGPPKGGVDAHGVDLEALAKEGAVPDPAELAHGHGEKA